MICNGTVNMEVGQADFVKAQKDFFMSKWYSYSLASPKVVYARDQDPVDTIIVRSLYPKLDERQRIFGLKGEMYLKTLFLVLLKLLKHDLKRLQKRVKYVTNQDFQDLGKAITEMEKSMQNLGAVVHDFTQGENFISMRFQTNENFVNVRLSSNSEFPYVKLVNEDKERNYLNSTSLFIGETINLLKYLISRFNINQADVLKLNSNEDIFKNDSFF